MNSTLASSEERKLMNDLHKHSDLQGLKGIILVATDAERERVDPYDIV